MTTPSDPLALLRSRSYVALLVLAAIIGVPVSAAAYFLSRPGQQDAGLDLHPLFQGEARQGRDLGLAAADVALIAFPGQEQEAFEVAAAFVDDAVDLPRGLVAAFAAAVVAAGLVRRAFCAPGRGLDRTVLEYVPTTYGTQDDGKPETGYHLIGSGQAVVFTDGGATTASWGKAADGAPTYLLGSAGKPVSLNHGITWYEIVPTGAAVSY